MLGDLDCVLCRGISIILAVIRIAISSAQTLVSFKALVSLNCNRIGATQLCGLLEQESLTPGKIKD